MKITDLTTLKKGTKVYYSDRIMIVEYKKVTKAAMLRDIHYDFVYPHFEFSRLHDCLDDDAYVCQFLGNNSARYCFLSLEEAKESLKKTLQKEIQYLGKRKRKVEQLLKTL